MAVTYEPLATVTAGSTIAQFSFSGISSAYTDLKLVLVGRSATGNSSSVNFRYNGDTTASTTYNISYYGNGSTITASSDSTSVVRPEPSSYSAQTNISTLFIYDIMHYRSSLYKTVFITVANDYNSAGNVVRTISVYKKTDVMTSLTVSNGDSWAAGSTATLYGIAKA